MLQGMPRRNAKRDAGPDDIELHNTFDDPIKAGSESSPYDVPREDRAAQPHAFASDIDQQKMIAQLRSEVAALGEQVRSLAGRIEKLEKG